MLEELNNYYSLMELIWGDLADEIFYEELKWELEEYNRQSWMWDKYEDYMLYLLNN